MDVLRRARIEQRPRGNTPGYIARAIEIGLAARMARAVRFQEET
jgi:hypothetical protein